MTVNALAAVGDVIIAIAMVILLHRARTGFRRCDAFGAELSARTYILELGLIRLSIRSLYSHLTLVGLGFLYHYHLPSSSSMICFRAPYKVNFRNHFTKTVKSPDRIGSPVAFVLSSP